MAVDRVDPADWLLDRRYSRRTTVYDLAWQPRRRTHRRQRVLKAAVVYLASASSPTSSSATSTVSFLSAPCFSWVCWIVPDNVKVNQMFVVTNGLAMGLLPFDWGQIAFNGSPLPISFWAAANIGATIVSLLYTNVWYSAYLPSVSSHSFDRRGKSYNVSRVIKAHSSFNLQAYYNPFFLSPPLLFLTVSRSHRSPPLSRIPTSSIPDIHARLMPVYKEDPDWWYLFIFLTMLLFGIVAIKVWETQFSVWAFVLAFLISFVYTVPIRVIQAITNQQVGLNVITELIIGYALPGHPIAMTMFKA
ncbi:OPT oligopeptide transporter protein-domain-containing protein [Lactifluus subvellereus]|nr:OPT oligopeptide transporter protein-domain-containing protein [Lactifluus subvellereus]